jgi:SAM-dependent methyltransferase
MAVGNWVGVGVAGAVEGNGVGVDVEGLALGGVTATHPPTMEASTATTRRFIVGLLGTDVLPPRCRRLDGDGAPGRIRTADASLRTAALYPLSYGGAPAIVAHGRAFPLAAYTAAVPGAYEYGGLKAATWDLFRGDTLGWEDRPFYLDLIRRFGEPALDVGCGTGRLLLDYLARGVDVDGVDDSPEMLALCRRRARELGLRPRLYRQKMERLALRRRYRTIFVPSSSFQLLIDPVAARRALSAFHDQLQPAGALVMPFLDRAGLAPPEGVTWTREMRRPEDGATVRRISTARFDEATGTESSSEIFELLVDGEVVEREEHHRDPDVRWYSQAHARSMFDEAGFEVHATVAGFTDRPAGPDGEVFTVIGVRS